MAVTSPSLPVAGIRLLVCGGRDFDDYAGLCSVLDDVHATNPVGAVLHGDASGADTLAARWADERRIRRFIWYAPWAKFGRAAGPIRNEMMLHRGKPDLVIAFPGGRGTADMINKSRIAGVETREVFR